MFVLLIAILPFALLEAVEALEVACIAGLKRKRRDTGPTAGTLPIPGKFRLLSRSERYGTTHIHTFKGVCWYICESGVYRYVL